MIEQDHKFKPGMRVSLKGEVTDLYPYAKTGNVGVVKQIKKDQWGYPMVYVEWDKDHWAYNNEDDLWTFESHFDPVGDDMGEESKSSKDRLKDAFDDFIDDIEGKTRPEPAEDKVDAASDIDSEAASEYEAVLEHAVSMAKRADGFMIVMVGREVDEATGKTILVPAGFESYKTLEARVIAEGQVGKLAGHAHEMLSLRTAHEILSRKPDGD